MKTYKQYLDAVLNIYGYETITEAYNDGQDSKIYREAAELYAAEVVVREELNANNEAHRSATRTLVKEAIKLARENMTYDWQNAIADNEYTESEILEKLKL